MTVDIARMETNTLVALDSANVAMERLGRWVEAASQANRLVAPLVNTPFVPDSYKPRIDPRATPEQRAEAHAVAVANATAAVLQGITLGLDPLTALQQIIIIHGRPSMYVKMMVALVQSHGHEVWDEDISDTRAVVAGRRRGTDNIVRITVTMDQARRAGWTRNDAYTKTPQDMLWSRAAGRVCDRIASDVLKGLASVEAVRDELDAENGNGVRTVAPRKRAPVRVAATVEPALAPEPETPPAPATRFYGTDDDFEPDLEPDGPAPTANPEPEPDLDDEPAPAAAVRMVTQPQHRKMHALWPKLGYGGDENRDQRLAIVSKIVGREVESSATLTYSEAQKVIDALVERERKTAQGGES